MPKTSKSNGTASKPKKTKKAKAIPEEQNEEQNGVAVAEEHPDGGVDDAATPGDCESVDDTGSPALVEQAAECTPESIVEAILFATDSPIPAQKIAQILGVGNAGDVKQHIERLNGHYAETGRSFRIDNIAKGYQMLTLPMYNNWLSKVLRLRSETKLTGAALEALAIIAYKQPVLRVDVESIRGVACGDMINRLREMNLVKIVGRAEELGRPMLYGTTKRFLEVFGLASLDDLPNTEELAPPKQ
ncbi:MAG: SMC-Scp complex subunit ScpB [Planctomycetes bacterium]|nr:SMC-Scp complex subunit ScpB [Planctomycetota bacterium]